MDKKRRMKVRIDDDPDSIDSGGFVFVLLNSRDLKLIVYE